ncbi:M20 family metallopeptidase [Aspergillus fijiensis CBS 313.89]|uniref:Zn-dependent exopeptidase n=1 Tax=Aspergillus fijiensis CBS 313.89 TaxID=1448319 RepID=A0A8G1S2X0_9EURO|nr:Zn-dependent exopeptidase [Aspergillus fijiensis CBS 313.89]RAK82435.1 Zn-dependent exopeptidase [Aspergillus fijiensis CBS 313.89]
MKIPIPLLLAAAGLAAAAPPQQSPLSLTTDPSDIIDASLFLSFHRNLVQIPSVSGNETAVGLFIADFLETHNFTVIKQHVPAGSQGTDPTTDKNRFNIFAYPSASPSQDRPEILLTSHIDTVPPFLPYTLHDHDPGNRSSLTLAGRGTVDAKASIAAQIFAVLETLKEQPGASLGLLFVVDEEVGGLGMRVFSESPLNPTDPSPFHTVIFGEPTELALVSGHKGMLEFPLVATGQAAHSGYPWLGRSAVSALLPALSRLDVLGEIPAEEGGLPASPKYGRTTVNIGRVDAGVAANVVPAKARAEVAIRLAEGTPDDARKVVAQAVKDATNGDESVYCDFEVYSGGYPPQDLDTDVPGFEVMTVNYGTDVPNLKVSEKVKRYLYGPGSIHVAHGDDEAITVGQLEEAVRGYKRLIDAAVQRGLKLE